MQVNDLPWPQEETLMVPSVCKLFVQNEGIWKLTANTPSGPEIRYLIRISYSDPLILSDVPPYIPNIAVLFYCGKGSGYAFRPLIHRALMRAPVGMEKVEMLAARNVEEAYDVTVGGAGDDPSVLRWSEFTLDLSEITDILCWQCESNEYIGCVHTAPDGFGTDLDIARYELETMDTAICATLCGHAWHFAVSGTKCYCDDNPDRVDPALQEDKLVPNSFCQPCPTGNAGLFCGDSLSDIWSVYWVPGTVSVYTLTYNSHFCF